MKLSILTDEVSQDLDRVVAFAREFQLAGVEVRSLFGQAFRDLVPAQFKEIRSRCDEAGLAISGCATPVFKCPLDDPAAIAEHRDIFARSVEAAHLLGCRVIRVFSFLRRDPFTTSDNLQRAAEHFRPLIEAARAADVIVGLENEASCLAGTGGGTAELLRHLPDSPHLGVVWDPCNILFLAGTRAPFPGEFNEIAERLCHVHVKDARREASGTAITCVELGTGEVDFVGQFQALRQRGYESWITLETHWRTVPLDAETQQLPAGHGFSADAEPASRICMAHLQKMVWA